MILLGACSGSAGPSDPVVVAPRPGGPVTSQPNGSSPPLAYFEGTVDAARGTMSVVTRLPTGEIKSAATLPYGTGAGDIYFHTCSVAYNSGTSVLSGTVQAVNLGGADTTHPVTAVIDSISETGATLGSGAGAGSPSGIIATYPTATSGAADCGSTMPWSFNLPGPASFSFVGHADGTAPAGGGTGGSGSDGALNVASPATFSTTGSHLAAAASAGNTSLSVQSASGLTNGDQVLVINVRSTAGNAGLWEVKPITNVTGTTLTLGSALANSYPEAGNTLVQRVPQYTTASITSTLTGSAWSSGALTGGIVAFYASGNVTIGAGGAIDVSGKGYTGGPSDSIDAASPTNKMPGESYIGLGADGTTNVNNAGGGAGGFHRGGCEGDGAGGGSYATAGTAGQTGPSCGTGGIPGATYGDASLSRIYFGSGGGAGGWANDPPRANGGAGGGIVIILSGGSITINGNILANGEAGHQETNGAGRDYGAGGGGAGGSIYLQGTSYSGLANAQVNGGAGGAKNVGEVGGNGGQGRVFSH